jgi:hypothetical protein
MKKNDPFKLEVEKIYGDIMRDNKHDASVQLRTVFWNNGKKRIDIRSWKNVNGKEICFGGFSFHYDQALKLKDYLINALYDFEVEAAFKEANNDTDLQNKINLHDPKSNFEKFDGIEVIDDNKVDAAIKDFNKSYK